MSLSKTRLRDNIKQAILDREEIAAIDGDALRELCEAIANEVIDELKNHGVVEPTALVAPNGGGPVTGAGTIS